MPNKTDFYLYKRATKYNPVNAYWLACCSLLVYKNGADVVREAKEWGLTRVDFISRKDTQCFVASDARVVVVAFRGTEMDVLQDILADIDIRKVKGYGGRVHAGFNRAYAAVRTQVRAKVAAHQDRGQTVWATGHSLGGANATLAAADLEARKVRVNGVYTFGQPRVGDADFVKAFGKGAGRRYFRLAKVDDPVPEIPPPALFQHAGQEVFVASRNRLTLRYRRSKNLLNRLQDLAKSLPSHGIVGYVKAMNKNFATNPFDDPDAVIKEKAVITPEQVKQGIETKAKKTGKTIERGAKSTGKKIERGAKSTGKKIERGAKNVGKKLGKLLGK